MKKNKDNSINISSKKRFSIDEKEYIESYNSKIANILRAPVNYGVLKYKTSNIGDYIQSLAAMQFIPFVSQYVDRDNLSSCKDCLYIILNGWFLYNINGEIGPKKNFLVDWPPPDNIIPLFISFHIDEFNSKYLLKKESIEYFKKYEPIGCRDLYTYNLLIKKNVKSYFSGCLTLTFQNTFSERDESIYIVDLDPLVFKSVYDNIIKNFNKKPICLSNSYKTNRDNTSRRFTIAKKIINNYSKAKLVITSRLHCALPCMALKTPVIFINRNLKDPRFSGLLDFLFYYSTNDVLANKAILNEIYNLDFQLKFNKANKIANDLRQTCFKFVFNNIPF